MLYIGTLAHLIVPRSVITFYPVHNSPVEEHAKRPVSRNAVELSFRKKTDDLPD